MDPHHKLKLAGLLDLVGISKSFDFITSTSLTINIDICAFTLKVLIEYKPNPNSHVFVDLFDDKVSISLYDSSTRY